MSRRSGSVCLTFSQETIQNIFFVIVSYTCSFIFLFGYYRRQHLDYLYSVESSRELKISLKIPLSRRAGKIF